MQRILQVHPYISQGTKWNLVRAKPITKFQMKNNKQYLGFVTYYR